MLRYRLITGPLLLILLLAVIMLDDYLDTLQLEGTCRQLFLDREHPPRGLIVFLGMLAIAPLAAVELSRIFHASGITTRVWLTSLAAMLGLILSYCMPVGTPAATANALLATGLIVVFVAALVTFSQHQNVQGVLAAAGAVVFAMVYLGLMLGFLLALRREHSAWWIVGIIVTTKSCDIAAYFTGTLIGKHKMIPWLSPGKTWEGLAGGIVFSVVVGFALAALSRSLPHEQDHVGMLLGAMCGAIFAVVGQFGDLTVSLFKRGAGLKDSSRLLPGMGGVLDVLDSPLMVAPVAYWLLTVAANA